MKTGFILVATATASIAPSAIADMTAVHVHTSPIQVTDDNGAMFDRHVQDLHVMSDDAADPLLNVYDVVLPEAAQVGYHQSASGTDRRPNNLGGPFDTDAVRRGDSFVTIGGVAEGVARPEQTLGAGDGGGWNHVTGADAFQPSGNGVAGDTLRGFTSGTSRTGTVIRVPVTSGLSLLGLSGLASGSRGRARQRHRSARPSCSSPQRLKLGYGTTRDVPGGTNPDFSGERANEPCMSPARRRQFGSLRGVRRRHRVLAGNTSHASGDASRGRIGFLLRSVPVSPIRPTDA